MEMDRMKVSVLEWMALMTIPSATIHNILSNFGFGSLSFPFKAYEYAVFLLCIAAGLKVYLSIKKKNIKEYAAALPVITLLAFFTAVAALVNALFINGPFNAKAFNEAGGFLLVTLGISSLYTVIPDGKRFIIRLLIMVLLLCTGQFVLSVMSARHMLIQALISDITPAYYVSASWQFSSLYSNPNTYGFYMLTGVCAAAALIVYFCTEKKVRCAALASLGFLVCLFGTVITASRASLAGCACMCVCFALFPPSRRAVTGSFKVKPLYAWGIALAMTGFLMVFLWKYIPAIVGKFDSGTIYRQAFWSGLVNDPDKFGAIDVVTANRFSYWRGFLQEQFRTFPSKDFFFGKGSFRPVNIVDPAFGMHNIYLEIWGKYGIFCSAGLIALLFTGVKKLIQRKDFFFIACIPAAFIVHGFFEDKIFVNSLHPQLLFLYFILFAPVLVSPKDAGNSGDFRSGHI